MFILGSPEGDAVNRSVHPLVLITVRPLIRFAAIFTADQWNLAAMIVVATIGAAGYFFQHRILEGSVETHLTHTSMSYHVLSDLWQSVGVVVAGCLVALTGKSVFDLVISLAIAAGFIVWAVKLFRMTNQVRHREIGK